MNSFKNRLPAIRFLCSQLLLHNLQIAGVLGDSAKKGCESPEAHFYWSMP